MPLPELASMFGFIASINFFYIGWVAAAIAALILIIWIMGRISSSRNIWGTSQAKEVDERAGLIPFRKAFRGAIQLSLAAASSTAPLWKAAWAKAKSLRGQGAESAAEEGAAKGTLSAVEAEKATAALEAIKGRALDLIAGMKLIEESLEKYANKAKVDDASGEKEAKFIENVGIELAKLSNYDKIDSAVVGYLRKIMLELQEALNVETSLKQGKRSEIAQLILALRMAVDEMKTVLQEAKSEEGIFKKYEKKARKDYSSDVKKLKDVLKQRKNNLKKEKSKGKNADGSLIATLEKEIALMERQYSAVNNLQKQLKINLYMVKDEIKKSMKVLKKLQKYDKKMRSIDKKVEKIESQMEKKLERSIKSAKELQNTLKSFEQGSDVYNIALSVSASLNEFLKENEKEAELDVEFDAALRGIIVVGYSMARLTVVYEQLIEGMTESDKTTEQAIEVLIKIMQGVVTDSQIQVTEQQAVQNIESLNKMLDNQKEIDLYLKKLIAAIKYKLNVLYSLIENLTNENVQLAASLQRYSGYIGHMIAVAFNRKLKIDGSYMSQAETFEKILEQKNETAYEAYKEAKAA